MRQFLSALLLLLALLRPAGGQEHEVRFERSLKVGDRLTLHLVSSTEVTQEITRGGETLDKQTARDILELRGKVEIAAVDEDGFPTRRVLEVERLTFRKGGEPLEAGLDGRRVVISMEEGGKPSFKLDDGELSAAAGEALERLVPKKRKVDEDELLATGRRRVGEAWQGNAAAMEKDFLDNDLIVRQEDIESRLTLAGEKTDDGVRYLEVEGTIELKEFRPKTLPPGFKCDEGSGTLTLAALIPVDLDSHSGQTRTELKAHMKLAGTGGNEGIEGKVAIVQTVEQTVSASSE